MTQVGTVMTKEEEAFGTHGAPQPVHTTVVFPPQQQFQQQVPQEVNHSGATCWYVFGILSTIFCCLPCGVVGLVHAMISKHEGERGNVVAHRRRLYQAKCWTSWSIALGLLCVVLFITAAVIAAWGSYGWDYDYNFSDGHTGFDTETTEIYSQTPPMHGGPPPRPMF